jgi:hypothetical protein
LSAVIRGNRDDADQIVEDFEEDEFPAVLLGPVDEVEVRQLAALMLKLDPDATSNLVAQEGSAMIAEASEDGPWLAELPSGMEEALSRLTPTDILALAQAWAPTLHEPRGVDPGQLVSSLAQLAHDRQPGESLLLWMRI